MYANQFRFRSKHSTLDAIMSITDKVQNAIEKGFYSCGLFLDLSKAFDTVDHTILLQKQEAVLTVLLGPYLAVCLVIVLKLTETTSAPLKG